jgi:hypothetical protein
MHCEVFIEVGLVSTNTHLWISVMGRKMPVDLVEGNWRLM